MDDVEQTTNGQTTWSDAAAASAEVEADRKAKPVPLRTFVEALACKLTEHELVAKGDELLAALAEVDELKDEKKASAAEFAAQIKAAEKKARDLRTVITTKTEKRDVEVAEERLYATNTVRVVRPDTGEIVRERAMTSSERQGELPLSTPPARAEGVEPPDFEDGDDAYEDDDELGAIEEGDTSDVDDEDTSVTDPQGVLDAEKKPRKAKGFQPSTRARRNKKDA